VPVSDIIKRKKRESITSLLQFPTNLGAHSMLLLFKEYKYNPPGSYQLNRVNESTYSQKLASTQSILLPLPANIEDSYNIRVQGFEQGIGGEAVSTAAAALGSSGDISPEALVRTLSKAIPGVDMASITDIDNVVRGAAYLGRRALDNLTPNVGRSLDAGLGSTINPKSSLYFEGMTQKVHTFNWTLSPSNAAESDTIREITNLMKRNSLPSYGSIGVNKILLNYPNMLDIFFLGVDQSYFIYYKTCMVQQLNVNFTPNGLALVKGGKPSMINISINVIEADIHTAEDYDGSGTRVIGDSSGPESTRN